MSAGFATQALAAQSLQQQMSALRIVTEEYPPLSFTNIHGQADGLATDVVREIMRRLDLDQEIQVWPWARGYNNALKGPNYVLYSVSHTPQRADKFHWVGCIHQLVSGLYAKKGSGLSITSLQDAKQVAGIGVYRDSMNDQILTAEGFTNLQTVLNDDQNIRKFMAGRVELLAATDLTLPYLVDQAGFSMQQLELLHTFAITQVYIAFSRQIAPEVVEAWRKAFTQMKDERVLQQLQQKWGVAPACL